jgi:hypothetical protein
MFLLCTIHCADWDAAINGAPGTLQRPLRSTSTLWNSLSPT